MMNNSGGALLTEVYGSESIKVKKKDKKKKEQGYIPSSKEHIYPQKLEKIDSFDEKFHGNSNIMPYGGFSSEGGYFPINKEDNIGGGSRYFPYEKYTLEGHRKPVPPTVKDSYVPERFDGYVPWGNFNMVKDVIKSNIFYPIFITGMSGNGKTLMVKETCAGKYYFKFRLNTANFY